MYGAAPQSTLPEVQPLIVLQAVTDVIGDSVNATYLTPCYAIRLPHVHSQYFPMKRLCTFVLGYLPESPMPQGTHLGWWNSGVFAAYWVFDGEPWQIAWVALVSQTCFLECSPAHHLVCYLHTTVRSITHWCYK